MTKKESPQDRARRVHAQLELAFSVANVKTARRPHPLGALAALLEPIARLRQIGTSDQIRKSINTVNDAAEINRYLAGNPADEREANAERLNILAGRLRRNLGAATKAEEKLSREGWKFDPKKDIAKSIIPKGQPGNAPQKFLLRCIEAAADNFPGLKGAPLREAIAKMLRQYFPADAFDTGPHGNIAHTLENARNKFR